MFGKPNWFRPKTFGWGLVPITWQGWAYTLAWGGLLVLPFWGLILRHQVVEGLAWIGCGTRLFCFDVRSRLRAMKPPVLSNSKQQDDVLYIGPESGAAELATRKYDM